MEDERKGKDAAWLLSHPRELCKWCLNWHECSDEPWDDMSGCAASDVYESHNYLMGYTESCREFFEDYSDSLDVDHINGIRDDNRVENLRMCTRKENCGFELSVYNKRQSAQKKPVLQFDLEYNFIAEYESTMEAQRQTGISNSNIYSCCINRERTTRTGNKTKVMTAGGYIWKFKEI